MKIICFEIFVVLFCWLFFKIEIDEGIIGWGELVVEGCVYIVEVVVQELVDYFVGCDLLLIEDYWQVMYCVGFYCGGLIMMSVIVGVDQVLWDIKGKYYGVFVYVLLGGQVCDCIKVYLWIGGDCLSDVVNNVCVVVECGFKVVKMNGFEELQIVDIYDKVEQVIVNVVVVCDVVGLYVGIGVDFYGCVYKLMVKVFVKEFDLYKLMFIEELVLLENVEVLCDIVNQINMLIVFGEWLYLCWDFKYIFVGGYVDIIQLDVLYVGGIIECCKIVMFVESYDVVFVLYCLFGLIVFVVCLQFDVVSYNVFIQEQSFGIYYNQGNDLFDYLCNFEVFCYEDGFVVILQGLGFGIDVNEEKVCEMVKIGYCWCNLVWCYVDGSVVEW